jgi:hypothetical protein
MREIKFRAQKISTGHPWVYGYVEVRANPMGKSPTFIHSFQDWNLNSREPVDGDTVGQFTGLKDKNGKEIYEGDIIDHPSWRDGGTVVEFRAPTFGPPMIDMPQCEVIGNIYETPELLAL